MWELIKSEIRSHTQSYSKTKAKKRNKKLKKLVNKLKYAQDDLKSNPCVEIKTVWENLKSELSIYHDHISHVFLVRSRADWMEKGENNNKCFLSLEKYHKASSTIRCIVNDDWTECHDENIIRMLKCFMLICILPKRLISTHLMLIRF